MQIHPNDNVEVRENGHKYALVPIKAGENVIKYGSPIGHATEDIGVGAHVHTHNLKTNLSGNLEYLDCKHSWLRQQGVRGSCPPNRRYVLSPSLRLLTVR